MDWIIRTLDEANKVLIINSYGSFHRYRQKLESQAPGGNTLIPQADDIFISQLDLIGGESLNTSSRAFGKFVMAYFEYTNPKFLLRHISPNVRFELPRNLQPLIGYIQPGFLPASKWQDTAEGQVLLQAVTALQARMVQIVGLQEELDCSTQDPLIGSKTLNPPFLKKPTCHLSSGFSSLGQTESDLNSVERPEALHSVHAPHLKKYPSNEYDSGCSIDMPRSRCCSDDSDDKEGTGGFPENLEVEPLVQKGNVVYKHEGNAMESGFYDDEIQPALEV